MDSLGDRIKDYYENRCRHYLTRRTPVILRLDGKAFHTYTKPLKNKFDDNLINVMNLTAIKLCEEIQGVQVAYIQSDEISLLLHDYKELTSEAWFNYNQSKIESISAAIASVEFTLNSNLIWNGNIKRAYFDSRSFNVPESDVCNYFIWRQKDQVRNSINTLGQSLIPHKQLQGKKTSEVRELCFQQGHNWNDLSTSNRLGRCAVKSYYNVGDVTRSSWIIDNEIPEFTKNRNYIEKYYGINT